MYDVYIMAGSTMIDEAYKDMVELLFATDYNLPKTDKIGELSGRSNTCLPLFC